MRGSNLKRLAFQSIFILNISDQRCLLAVQCSNIAIVNKIYTLFDGLKYNTRGYFASCVVLVFHYWRNSGIILFIIILFIGVLRHKYIFWLFKNLSKSVTKLLCIRFFMFIRGYFGVVSFVSVIRRFLANFVLF